MPATVADVSPKISEVAPSLSFHTNGSNGNGNGRAVLSAPRVLIAEPLGSPDEYLEMEEFSNVKHEYVNGRIYAMAGAEYEHNRVGANIIREMGNCARGTKYEVLTSDQRTHVGYFRNR